MIQRLPVVLSVMALSLLAPSGLIWSQTQEQMRFVRLSLAGVRIGDTRRVYDPQERYYLIGTGDCDGAHMSLTLTPDPTAEGWGADQDMLKRLPRVSLPRLRTGKGVNIGESPSQAQRKLGRVPDLYSYDRTKKERIYEYRTSWFKRTSSGKKEKMLYTGVYKFRNERLWSISYRLSEADGCG